jgi:hypothetical protein
MPAAPDYKIIARKAIRKFFLTYQKNILDNPGGRQYRYYEHILINMPTGSARPSGKRKRFRMETS